MSGTANLIIKLNENPFPGDCPLCGGITNPKIGAELFLADTETIVCIECASKHSPILACLETFDDLARRFQLLENPTVADFLAFEKLSKLTQTAEEIFANQWKDGQNFSRNSMNTYQSFRTQKAEMRH